MRRKLLPVALTLALACAIPLAAQAADDAREKIDVTDNHGIHQYTDAQGETYEIATVTLETQPANLDDFGCATGQHTAKAYTAEPVTAHNGLGDPSYPFCIIETRQDWACEDCGTEGTDVSARAIFWGWGGTEEPAEPIPFILTDTDLSQTAKSN